MLYRAGHGQVRIIERRDQRIGRLAHVVKNIAPAGRRDSSRPTQAQQLAHAIQHMNTPGDHHPTRVIPKVKIVPVEAIGIEAPFRGRTEPEIIIHSWRWIAVWRMPQTMRAIHRQEWIMISCSVLRSEEHTS